MPRPSAGRRRPGVRRSDRRRAGWSCGHCMRAGRRAASGARRSGGHDVGRSCRPAATIRRTPGNLQGRGPTRVPAAVHPHRDLGHGDPMTTRYLMRLGKTPFDVVDPFLTLDRNLLGTNSGNLIYGAVAHKLFSTKDTEVDANYYRINAGMAAAVNDEYDGFIVHGSGHAGVDAVIVRVHLRILRREQL